VNMKHATAVGRQADEQPISRMLIANRPCSACLNASVALLGCPAPGRSYHQREEHDPSICLSSAAAATTFVGDVHQQLHRVQLMAVVTMSLALTALLAIACCASAGSRCSARLDQVDHHQADSDAMPVTAAVYIKVFQPSRAEAAMSPSSPTPSTSAENISGITSMNTG
jgi:hypothetical protein